MSSKVMTLCNLNTVVLLAQGIHVEAQYKHQNQPHVGEELRNAYLPNRLAQPNPHLGYENGSYARYYPYVKERVQGKRMLIYLAHDLPEEFHHYQYQHEVAYYVRHGVLRIVKNIRPCLDE